MESQHAMEIDAGIRFPFGRNWARFLKVLNAERITLAENSLRDMLRAGDLKGKNFVDIGSGSGLSSLAARNLGAAVRSFDFDPQSVACTKELKSRYFKDDPLWKIEHGSALDAQFMSGLGSFDIVYSWGVLHHTGRMYEAIENSVSLVAEKGQMFLAIYNDQGPTTKYWTYVKRAYNRNRALRFLMIVVHTPYLFGMRWLIRASTGRLSVERGMSLWHDMLDWLGGYPFEVAKPEQIFELLKARGFILERLRTCGGRMGCNEFVFRR